MSISYDEAMATLTAPGGPFALTDCEIAGQSLKVFEATPPSLGALFENARSKGDEIFLVYEDERWTFARTMEQVDAMGALLVDRYGIQPGDRVAIAMRNYPEWITAFAAITSVGAIAVSMNAWWKVDELAYGLEDSGARVLICDTERLRNALAPLATTELRALVVRGEGPLPDGADHLEAVIELGAPLPEVTSDPDDDVTILYTSGTTGNPKGSLYSHRSTVLHAFGLLAPAVLPYGIGKAVLPVVPMFHVQAWGQPYAAPIAGTKLVMPGPKLDGESLFELMEDEGVTLTLGVPTIWMGLLTHLRETGKRFTHLTHLVSGGAAIPLSMIKAYEEEFGLNVVQGWGMTETSPVCCAGAEGPEMDGLEDDARHELKLRERKFFGVDLRLVDEDGGILPHDGDTPGELQCRGPWVINGYYNDAEATAAAMTDDGWFRTGDVATLTDAGLLQITDRTKDLIKSGGEWISSIDLENEVMSHPGVAEAAAIAMPHPKWQERPMLVIVAHEGKQPSANELRAHLADKIVSWWMPDDIAFVDELPHTATGKVSKLQLRERFKDHVLSTV